MFNNFDLSNEEIFKIIYDYEKLIIKKSVINNKLDEDLKQEIIIRVYRKLSKNRKIFEK